MNSLQKLDTFLRFAGLGQLVLFVTILVSHRPFTTKSCLLLLLCPSVGAYLLLTAPDGAAFEAYRGILLAVSHATPYLAWALGFGILHDEFKPADWPAAARFLVAALALGHFYYFIVFEGRGPIHDISHAVYLLLFAHLAFMAIRGLKDDLVEPRRRFRILLLAFASVQLSLIVVVELTGIRLGNPDVTNALNAGVFFALITAIGAALLSAPAPELLANAPSGPRARATLDREELPAAERALYERLTAFMDAGGYRATNLGIGELAAELSVPEHRLRRLINRGLGFRNFSAFLNQYRIREACEKLGDEALSGMPVLTIALDLGYGSIGPFNRAFKAMTGQTPTAYRRSRQG